MKPTEGFGLDEKTLNKLIVTAVKNCKKINPTNPQAVAEALPEIVNTLRLILPLAKGYVNSNKVGSNEQYIIEAEQALNKVKGERG